MKLTGLQRIKLTLEWVKRGKTEYMDKEKFIKAVCEAKGIEYSEPIKVRR